jgi:hypothetical protein
MTPQKQVACMVTKKLRESQMRCGCIQGIQRILEPVIAAECWDHLLLALSNICVGFCNGGKTGRKLWYRRARVLHAAMEKERSRRLAHESAEAGAEVA